MANYNSLKATINADIKTNHEQEITGSILNSVLIGMVDNLAAGYLFKGVATPATNPGTPDQNVCYIAGAGTYTHFNNTTIDDGEVGVFLYNGAWTVERVSLASANSLTISTDVPDLGYNEADPQTIADQMGQSVEDVLSASAVRFEDGESNSYYKAIGSYGEAGGYITFIGRDKVYQYNVDANGYITDTKVTSLAPDDELSENSENAVQNKVVKAAFDAKQDKDTNAVAGNVAVMDANGNSKGSNVPLDNVAKIDGQYDTLTSGYAGNLIDKSDAGSEQQIMFRKTGGATKVAASTRAMFKRLLGRTIVWNQLIQNGDFSNGTTGWIAYHSTIEMSDGVMRVNYNGGGTTGVYQDYVLTFGARRVIYVEAYVRCATAKKVRLTWLGYSFGSTTLVAGQWTKVSAITTVEPLYQTYRRIGVESTEMSEGEYYEVRSFRCTDLTVMYGAGYEPASVAEFENVYNKPYYPHCTAEFIHNVAQTYEAIGLNQWDEEWETGAYNASGDPVAGANTIRSKNYNKCNAGAEYYFKIPDVAQDSYMGFICWYDADKNFIKREAIGPYAYLTRTSPANACYFRFDIRREYGTVYNHDICINLSNADINDTYASYVKATATLGLSAFRVKDGQGNITTIHGLKGTGATYNEIDVENKTYIERVEMRAYQSGDDSDTSVLTDGTNTLAPLAEPVVYDLVDEMPEYSQVWGVGTENILPEGVDENGVPKTTPLRAVIYYPKDYTGIINNLPKNYISKDSLTNMLNALKSAGIIRSFTMTWNAEMQMYNFTIS